MLKRSETGSALRLLSAAASGPERNARPLPLTYLLRSSAKSMEVETSETVASIRRSAVADFRQKSIFFFEGENNRKKLGKKNAKN